MNNDNKHQDVFFPDNRNESSASVTAPSLSDGWDNKKGLRIVIDDKIPYIRDAVSRITDRAVYLPGSGISSEDVRHADALIVRTRTRCDEKLLRESSVRFVATATIGFDHIDTDYMRRAGITWMNCPGCNSASVAQYLRSVMILLRRDKSIRPEESTVGVVGCGHVGSKVAQAARDEGFRVLVCDPPLAEKGQDADFVTMDVIERECDIITFHVPLTRDSAHPTFHLADRAFFDRLARRPVIINTSRGAVVDNDALLDALIYNKVKDAVVDTWEHEPQINLRLLDRVWIATPHIAGYSADGKVNADNMVLVGLCRHFHLTPPEPVMPPALPQDMALPKGADDLRLTLYNPLEDSQRLKSAPEQFEWLRGNYPLRREETVLSNFNG